MTFNANGREYFITIGKENKVYVFNALKKTRVSLLDPDICTPVITLLQDNGYELCSCDGGIKAFKK